MTGAYESVTGMDKERVIERTLHPEKKRAFHVAEKEPWFCGFMIDIDLSTSLARQCFRLQCRTNSGHTYEHWFVSKVSS